MLNVFALRNPFLDVRMGSAKTIKTRIVERPGKWMKPEECKEIVNDIRSVVSTLAIGDLNYGIAEGSQDTLDNAIITLIYDGPTGRPVAFNALRYLDCSIRNKEIQVIHLGLVIVDPDYQAKGLSWILYGLTTFLLFFKNRMRPIWISNVTQVPAAVGLVSEGFSHVYPSPLLNTRRSYDHLILAREIMSKHRGVFGVGSEAEFDEDAFIIRNAYTGGSDNLKKTFEVAPKHRRSIYNDFCQKLLNYERGDDFLQIGKVSMESFYTYFARSVPSSSAVVVVYQLFFQFLEGVIAPVYQWFSPSKAMGVLRARGK